MGELCEKELSTEPILRKNCGTELTLERSGRLDCVLPEGVRAEIPSSDFQMQKGGRGPSRHCVLTVLA